MPTKILEVKNLSVTIQSEKILENISFDINQGEIVSIIGPNGAGKTTLLKAILGIIPYQGEINWLKKQKVSYIPQKLETNTGFPISIKEVLDYYAKAPDREEVLDWLDLSESENKSIRELSGGQFQRFLIAFALLQHPDLLLFDEPTSGLDIFGAESIYIKLKNLSRDFGRTLILVSHDLSVILKISDRVICLNQTICCVGPTNELSDETIKKLYHQEVNLYGHQIH
ncbi:MAG: metal ABC transporter ATP-binding protein [Patescibacteria group bacterium]|nr:metal ABC transporter ATP-binding protein [Patescibacteria group bacterium]